MPFNVFHAIETYSCILLVDISTIFLLSFDACPLFSLIALWSHESPSPAPSILEVSKLLVISSGILHVLQLR